jgi:hypothetical protein
LPLSGKKILFFSPKFFGYEKAILREMENMGADVTFRSGQPFEHPWSKGFIRLFPRISWYYSDRVYLSWLNKNAPKDCDLIFIVKGEGLSPNFLRTLRTRYPAAHVVLYLFDNIKNCRLINLKFPYIDEIFSFDPFDCRMQSRLKYRPLFFLDEYLKEDLNELGRGLFFIGTLNGDRPKIIYRLLASLPSEVGVDYWLFVRSRLELAIRKLFDRYLGNLDISHFLFKPMPLEIIKLHLNKCLAVLDIEHPKQIGLTMRTFETIASGKKLITTNKVIREHDFYDPSRIYIIKRDHPSLPPNFLISKVSPLSKSFVSKYSLRGWLLEILNTIIAIKHKEAS